MQKTNFIVSILILFTTGVYSQTGWFPLNPGTNRNFKGVYFVDQNTGYITGDTTLKTTNGGQNWTFLGIHNSYGIYFQNSLTGYLGYTSPDNSSVGIGRTTDGGLSWAFINVPGLSWEICFINDMTGWAACGYQFYGSVNKTTNAGESWFACPNSTGAMTVQFLDTNTGYSLNSVADTRKSTNGGLNWITMPQINGYSWISMQCTDINTIYLGAEIDGGICKSTDGANTWILQPTGINLGIESFSFVNANTGYAVGGDFYYNSGNQVILKTTNGGTNWVQQQGVPPHALYNVYFINSNTGWAVGDSGRVIKTTDGGGIIGIRPISNNIPPTFSLSQNYPNPFNPTTKIEFSIPHPLPLSNSIGEGGNVVLIIYDILGREVATLVNEKLQPGTYEVQWDASNYPSGVYYYQLTISNSQLAIYRETKRMVLVW